MRGRYLRACAIGVVAALALLSLVAASGVGTSRDPPLD